MTNLEKLYSIIEYSNDTGVELGDNVLRQVEELEESIIKEEILPALCQDIAPRLNPIKRDLVLVVEYHPGKPISVALSRKVKISDFVDAKPLTPISRPVSSNEKPVQQTENYEPTKHIENATKGLKVIFPDGTEICHHTAIKTYIAAIKYIGYARVSALGITRSGYNIVSQKKRPTVAGRIWQHKSNGWYIYSNTNNIQKKEDLKRISDMLHLGLRVEEGKSEK